MANPEHLEILKQGVEVWNRWREDKWNPERPYLVDADLSRKNFSGIDLHLSDLIDANLRHTNLQNANLTNANLPGTDLRNGCLIDANLENAFLKDANLDNANLSGANLKGADLSRASLSKTVLKGADFTNAMLIHTNFDDVDFNGVKGLDTVTHYGPSFIDIHTIYRSKGKIPKSFLRGAGIPDTFITYADSLTQEAIQYYSCFISYSSEDEAFAQRLHADLQQKGVRCWFAPEDMKIGDKIRAAIDQSIRVHDKLLLVLSENSAASQWVEQEVETALERERKQEEKVLFPVRLDEAVMEIESGWPALIRNTRHIGDFSRWKDHDAYQAAFERLLRDLKAEG